MMINNCSSTSNPLPQNEDFISPPQLVDPILFKAAMEGNTNYLQTLQDLSNLLLTRTTCNETVLHIATEFNRMEFARLSIQICPPLSSLVNSSGDTALHIAAREGHTEMVGLFLSFHDPNLTRMVNSENDTALHCSARSGNTECVKLLVLADPKVCGFVNKAHESPLYLLITSRQTDDVFTVTKCIIDYAGSSATHKGPNGLTALHAALLYGETALKPLKKWGREIAEPLVKWRREMIREGDSFGMTPFHYAAFYGKVETIQLFLQYDSLAIYYLNNHGQSAVHVAAFSGKAEVLQLLVKCRPDCYNLVDKNGRTALHAAVLGNQHGVVEFILKTPSLASLANKVDKDGNSPLHLAAYFKSYKIIKSLRCKEAKFFLNHNSYTPFDVYQKHSYENKSRLQLKLEKDKVRPKDMGACYYLEFDKGVVAKHESANEELKRMNTEVVTNSREEISLRNNQLNKSAEGKDFGEEVSLLVAILVATVTFAAGFTVPGGFISDGNDAGQAALADKSEFKIFVFFNSWAFFCSIYAVLTQFNTSILPPEARVYFKWISSFFTTTAILAMVFAFCSGTSVVLTKSTALAMVPNRTMIFFSISYCIGFISSAWWRLRKSEVDLDHLSLSIFTRAKLFMVARRCNK